MLQLSLPRATLRRCLPIILTATMAVWPAAFSQQPSASREAVPPNMPALRWAESAAEAELQVVNYDTRLCLRYHMRRRDKEGEVAREVIDSTDGPVARLLERNGAALSVAEDTAERERLQGLLNDPDSFFRHQHREAGSRVYATELLKAMPAAMEWSYVAGQPQLPGARSHAVVLDFQPDPNFKPPSLVTEALTGVAGRVWIDESTHVVTRIQGSILHPVNFGWGGMLARIRQGGTLELEQAEVPSGRWLYTHLIEHLTIREVLVHTTEENAETVASEVQALPQPVSYKVAIQMLLAMPVATR